MIEMKEYIIRFLYDSFHLWYKDVCSVYAKNKTEARRKFYEEYDKKRFRVVEIEEL